jgi:hypothetical protein
MTIFKTLLPKFAAPLILLFAILALGVAPAVAAAEKPTVVSESASEVKATEAHLNAVVIPNGETSECHFQYGVTSIAENEVPCESQSLEGEEKEIGVNVSGLAQNSTYHYQVILTNPSGTTEGDGTPAEFTTLIGPAAPEKLEGEATAAGVKLKGVLEQNDSGSPETYEFLYAQSASECTGGVATPPKPATGAKEDVEGEVTGLLPNSEYTFCLRVRNERGEEATSTSITLTAPELAPTITEESFSNVGSASATLHAKVDPGGALTSYYFQYGPTTAYGYTTPVESAGAASEPVSVLANIEDLTPNTEYHFRVVASNARATNPVPGADDLFSTFPVGLLGLPDERGYELVSSLNNGDSTVVLNWEHPAIRAAANGSAVAYLGTPPPIGGNGHGENTRAGTGTSAGDNEYLAERSATDGWSAADIQPDGLDSAGYQSFSSDFSVGILSSDEALVEGAPNGQGDDGLYSRDGGDGGYDLLAAGASYAGSTPDGSHILLSKTEGLYDSVGGRLVPVSVLREGGLTPDATFGSTIGDLERAISNDGSRIFWTDTTTGDLYVRENDDQSDASTTLIAEGAQFRTASSDGSKVFFTDEKQLTSDAKAVTGAPDLYEYDVEDKTLTDLTAETQDPSKEHANVVGVLGASENGSYVYFAAAGALANSDAAPQECLPYNPIIPIITQCNIYFTHDGETPKFVATVTNADGEGGAAAKAEGKEALAVPLDSSEVKSIGDWVPTVGDRSAEVAPQSGQLVLESVDDLTGFDNGGGVREIYTYKVGSGLSCVSCNPSGVSTLSGGTYFAHAELPQSFSSTYALRDISADGNRVFFNTREGLVSQDKNNLTDAYEWESPGEGGCTAASSSYSSANDGCLYDLSGGTSTDISAFLDASENGNDVFIGTRAQLLPQDKSEAYEVYDVRVGATTPPAEPECTGTGCQGVPAAPPIFATPSSVTFNGTGNFPAPKPAVIKKKSAAQLKAEKLSKALKACHADKRAKKRKTCESAARRKYGSSKKAKTKGTK